MDDMVELVRLTGFERLHAMKRTLAACGIEAEIWHEATVNWRRCSGPGQKLRLMVSEHDALRARWVLAGAGLDAWPDDGEARHA